MLGELNRRLARDQADDRHVFVNGRPVDSYAVAEQFTGIQLIGPCVRLPWKPRQRHGKHPAVIERYHQARPWYSAR